MKIESIARVCLVLVGFGVKEISTDEFLKYIEETEEKYERMKSVN